MNKKEEWLVWIDDQLKDMGNEDSYLDNGINRVFKTGEDDRAVAVYLLRKLRSLIDEL